MLKLSKHVNLSKHVKLSKHAMIRRKHIDTKWGPTGKCKIRRRPRKTTTETPEDCAIAPARPINNTSEEQGRGYMGPSPINRPTRAGPLDVGGDIRTITANTVVTMSSIGVELLRGAFISYLSTQVLYFWLFFSGIAANANSKTFFRASVSSRPTLNRMSEASQPNCAAQSSSL